MSMEEIRKNTVALLAVVTAVLAIASAKPVKADCRDLHFACANGSEITFGMCLDWSGCHICHSNWQEACRERDVRCDDIQDGGKTWNTPAKRIDGCSVSGGSYNQTFEPACNEHDVCYGTPGRRKEDCDADFYKNMATQCNNNNGRDVNSCMKGAAAYLAGVREHPDAQKGYNWGQEWAVDHHCNVPQARRLVFSRKPGSSSQTVSYWAGSALPQGGGGPVPDFVNPPQPAWIDVAAGGSHTIEYTKSQPIGLQNVFFNIIKNNDKDHAICVVSAELHGDGTLTKATSNCPSSITVTTNHNDVVVSLPLQL